MKNLFFTAFLMFTMSIVNCQMLFHLPMDIYENNLLLQLGDVGGWNNPQFSAADLNNDGIEDLVVFDRTDNRYFTFLNGGTPNTVDYTYAPKYQKNMPPADEWMLIKDYNCDGIPDIFGRWIEPTDGITVHKGSYNANNELVFERVINYSNYAPNVNFRIEGFLFYYLQSGFPANIYVSRVDLPGVEDIDGDGDIDILNFDQNGGHMLWYENQSVEQGFGCDSLIFEVRTNCWGRFKESTTNNNLTLSPSLDSCVGKTNFIFGKYQINSDTLLTANNGSVRHVGSTNLPIDIDGDGDTDILIGDLSSTTMVLGINGYNADTSLITGKDSIFPNYDVPIRMNDFPAAFHVDFNNDNKKDLLVAPNEPNASQNINCSMFYENVSQTQVAEFQYIQDDFLIGEMLDVGSRAVPVYFDHNSDGLLDLVIGSQGEYSPTGIDKGRLHLYENTGTTTEPVFTLIDNDYLNIAALNVRSVHPTFGDIDGDNDQDLIIGIESGKLYFFENTAGAGNIATFATVIPDYQGIDAGQNAAPLLVDINRDGLIDLLVGEKSGTVTYHENSGTANNPFFSVITVPFGNNSVGGIDVRALGFSEGHAAPFAIERNGEYELFIGSQSGAIHHYDSIDNNLTGAFAERSDQFSNLKEGEFTRLAIADINADGFLDFVIGNQRGGIRFYSLDTNTVNTNSIVKNQLPEITLFPNPANDFINLNFNGENYQNLQIYIVNNLGQVIDNQIINNHNNMERINLPNLPNGIYFCRIQTEKGVLTKSFIVK
jgi:hypothetical protein